MGDLKRVDIVLAPVLAAKIEGRRGSWSCDVDKVFLGEFWRDPGRFADKRLGMPVVGSKRAVTRVDKER